MSGDTGRAESAADHELLGGVVEPCQVELDIDLTITAPADADPGDVDPTDIATVVTGARLPSEVTRRYGCDGTVRLTATNHTTTGDGQQAPSIGVGRRTKVVPRWLRRRLERRDHYTCRFPSCTSSRRLHQSLPEPPDLDPTTVADPNGLFATAGAGERYDRNYAVDVIWTVNDHHRRRFRGTVTADELRAQ